LVHLLKIKTDLVFENKQIVVFEKIRTTKKALKRLNNFDRRLSSGYPIVATINSCNAKNKQAIWEQHLKENIQQ